MLSILAIFCRTSLCLVCAISYSAKPRSILVFSGRYHIISSASIVNNCIIYIYTFKIAEYEPHPEKTFFAFAKTKAQISCMVTAAADQCLCFVFATKIVQSDRNKSEIQSL